MNTNRKSTKCFDGELAVAHVEKLLDVGPEEVDDEDVVEAADRSSRPAECPRAWQVSCILVAQLGCVGLAGFLDMRR